MDLRFLLISVVFNIYLFDEELEWNPRILILEKWKQRYIFDFKNIDRSNRDANDDDGELG